MCIIWFFLIIACTVVWNHTGLKLANMHMLHMLLCANHCACIIYAIHSLIRCDQKPSLTYHNANNSLMGTVFARCMLWTMTPAKGNFTDRWFDWVNEFSSHKSSQQGPTQTLQITTFTQSLWPGCDCRSAAVPEHFPQVTRQNFVQNLGDETFYSNTSPQMLWHWTLSCLRKSLEAQKSSFGGDDSREGKLCWWYIWKLFCEFPFPCWVKCFYSCWVFPRQMLSATDHWCQSWVWR